MPTATQTSVGAISPEEAVRRVARAREVLVGEVHKVIVGQDEMIEQMLITLFARGHCLTIGVPGLAKTLAVSTLAAPHPVATSAAPTRAAAPRPLSVCRRGKGTYMR